MTQKLSGGWARGLFYGGGVFFLFLFLAMTFDTSLIINRRDQIGISNLQSKSVPIVLQGKYMWEKYHCVGCHTLLGEGAYFAPELGNVYQRYDNNKEVIKKFIKHRLDDGIQGQRSMPQFNLNEQELDALIEFLQYSSKIHTAQWPPHQEG